MRNKGMRNKGAKKSLGQHFLQDPNAIEQIVHQVPPSTPLLLEIGPGRGALTHALAARAEILCLIEKDESLLKILEAEITTGSKAPKNLFCWCADAAHFDYHSIQEKTQSAKKLTVVSNLPYNMATEILLRLVQYRDCIEQMTLMFQKEVAQRIAASNHSKAYSSLSILLQNFFHIKSVGDLPPSAFFPPPKVSSTVLHFTIRQEPLVALTSHTYPHFEALLRGLFHYRRKTLENSIQLSHFIPNHEPVLAALKKINIDGRRRAESLEIQEIARLFQALDQCIL